MKATELRSIIARNNRISSAVESLCATIIRLNPMRWDTLAEARVINGVLVALEEAGYIKINEIK